MSEEKDEQDQVTMPIEPMSQMGSEAVPLHELFVSLMEGGFTENQALKLIAYHMVAMSSEDNNGDDKPS